MRQLFALLICSILAVGNLAAQVSVAGASPVTEATFDNTVKTENIALEHDREKQLRAERRKIRHERNTIEFNAGLSGSLSNFNSKWQSVNGNTNSITAIANIITVIMTTGAIALSIKIDIIAKTPKHAERIKEKINIITVNIYIVLTPFCRLCYIYYNIISKKVKCNIFAIIRRILFSACSHSPLGVIIRTQ